MSNDVPVRVLYIAGSVRSGSTVLDKVLGEMPGYFAGGELCYIWERGLVENWLCGCGARFRDCEVWSRVLREAFGSAEAVDAARMVELQRRVTRLRHLPRIVRDGRNGGRDGIDLDGLPENLLRLYRALRATTGSRIIVDSSKLPGYGYVLSRIPGIDLRVVHLVRDPRAVAHSWGRRKPRTDSSVVSEMDRAGPLKSSVIWSLWNVAAEALWSGSPERYRRLRYEDFVRRPADELRAICAWLGEVPASWPFVADDVVELHASHTVSGNPNRLETGRIRIRPDLEWIARMPPVARATVTALTWPLLRRYRYPAPTSQASAAG